MVDYHNSFNAALILELVRLRNPTAHVASTDDTNSVHITTITDVLRIAGQKGDDFAQDCFTVLVDFRHLVEKLLTACREQAATQIFNIQTHNSQIQSQNKSHIDAVDSNNTQSSAAKADSSCDNVRHEDEDQDLNVHSVLEESFNLTNFEYRGMFDEFTAWLQDDLF